MAVRPILLAPNVTLETPSKKVRFSEETKGLIKDLVDTLLDAKNPEGAGLAAPQIGVLERVIVARDFFANPDNPEEVLSKEYIFINPKIISKSRETEVDYEGCLSIPDTYGKVERAKKIKIKALDEKGNTIRLNTSGFLARVIQHEIDHLDGILFTSKMVGEPMTETQLDALNENTEDEE